MTTQRKRRGVETVPLFSHVTTQTKGVIDSIAASTGTRKNVVIERIIEHLDLDADGVPTWWPAESAAQEEFDLRVS